MFKHIPYKLRKSMIQVLGPIGLYQATKYVTKIHPRILMYHRFSNEIEHGKVCKDTFEQQIIELKDNFNIMPLTYISSRLSENKSIPDNTIIITIDDGYSDFYHYAYPVLLKYDVPATIYITTDFIDGRIWLWPDKISHILKQTECDHIYVDKLNYKFPLAGETDRNNAWQNLITYCNNLTQDDRSNFIDQIAHELDITVDNYPPSEFAAMNWTMTKEIANNGIDIGAHTKSHPILSREDKDKVDEEISGCKSKIESVIHKPVDNFCYPNGLAMDYTEQVKNIVIKSGYKSAVTAFYDKWSWTDHYEIRRHGVGEGMYHFRKAIYGLVCISAWL